MDRSHWQNGSGYSIFLLTQHLFTFYQSFSNKEYKQLFMKTITFLNYGKKILFAAAIGLTATVSAQEEEEKDPFSISGSVDAYYRTNLTSTSA